MRTVRPCAFFLALLSSIGCGASISEHVAQQQWVDACDGVRDDDELREARGRYLAGEFYAASESNVAIHIFTPEELAETLPHVPARLANGEALLVSTDVTDVGDAGDFSVVVGLDDGNTWIPKIECCEVREWLTLDGREAEWEQMRRQEREAAARRERYRGPFGFFRAMGEMVVGIGSDLTYISTLGIVDLDVSDLPMANVSPVQRLRRIGTVVQQSVNSAGSRASAEDRSRRRAETLMTLTQLFEAPGCYLRPGETCNTIAIFDVGSSRSVAGVSITVSTIIQQDEDGCVLDAKSIIPIADGQGTHSLAEIFPPVPAPR